MDLVASSRAEVRLMRRIRTKAKRGTSWDGRMRLCVVEIYVACIITYIYNISHIYIIYHIYIYIYIMIYHIDNIGWYGDCASARCFTKWIKDCVCIASTPSTPEQQTNQLELETKSINKTTKPTNNRQNCQPPCLSVSDLYPARAMPARAGGAWQFEQQWLNPKFHTGPEETRDSKMI